MRSGHFKCYLYASDSLMDIPRKPLLNSAHQCNCILDLSAWISNRYLKSTALNSHIFLSPLAMFFSLPCTKSVLSTVLPPLNYGSSISTVAWARILGVLLVFSPPLIPHPVLLSFPLKIYHKSDHFLPALLLPPKLEPPSFLAQIRATVS